jgi:hypothetical protein
MVDILETQAVAGSVGDEECLLLRSCCGNPGASRQGADENCFYTASHALKIPADGFA